MSLKRFLSSPLGSAVPTILIGAVLSLIVHLSFIGHHLEVMNLDAWLLFQPIPESSRVALVEISDRDYENLFESTSPLPTLSVRKLINAVALSGAATIVIDLDTSSWSGQDRRAAYRVRDEAHAVLMKRRRPSGEAPEAAQIVWALNGSGDTENPKLDPIRDKQPGECFAAPALILDEDASRVRGFLPYIRVDGQDVPSLAIAASNIHTRESEGCQTPKWVLQRYPPGERMIVNYRGAREAFAHVPAGVVMTVSQSSDAWKEDNPLLKKIAIIGGTFAKGRDRYNTPVGVLDGANVLAHAIESAGKSTSVAEASIALFVLIDLLLGTALSLLGLLPKSRAVVWCSIAVVPAAMLVSLSLYHSFQYFASFVPVTLAVAIHQFSTKRTIMRRTNTARAPRRQPSNYEFPLWKAPDYRFNLGSPPPLLGASSGPAHRSSHRQQQVSTSYRARQCGKRCHGSGSATPEI